MPSPFPGMDPYLEDPAVWSSFHHLVITAATEELQPQLRPRGYFAAPGERVWLTEPRRPVYPDVTVSKVPRRRTGEGSVAVAEPDEPIRVGRATVEIREPYIDIYDRRNNRIVTGIEFLSPTNKWDREGRNLYARKQREAHEAGIHLVEVDLLRGGPHVLDVPEAIVADLPRWDYLVNLARRGGEDYEFYTIRLHDRLPRIRVPLKADDQDTILDLQTCLNRAYDIGPFPEMLNYAADPAPPLEDDDAAWADQILRQKGLRS